MIGFPLGLKTFIYISMVRFVCDSSPGSVTGLSIHFLWNVITFPSIFFTKSYIYLTINKVKAIMDDAVTVFGLR